MFRKLFLTAAFLLFSLLAVAQETGERQKEEFLYWESVLDAYEDFANVREQLRGSRRAAETLREKQLRIEGLLQHPIGKMTSQQQQRFNAISLRAGLPLTIPATQEEEAAPKPATQQPAAQKAAPAKPLTAAPSTPQKAEEPVQTAVIPLREPRVGRIGWHQPEIRSSLTYQPIPAAIIPPVPGPIPKNKIPWHYYVLLQTGFSPQWQLGLMAGARHPSGLGFYTSWRIHPAFTRLGNTYVAEHPDLIWTNGKSAIKEMAAHAGLLAGVGPVVIYMGAGYGSRTVFWQDSDNAWAQISSASFSGVSVEVGGMVPLGRLCLGLGVGTLAFKNIGVTAGIGVHF
jgi:hypothetical protein